MEELSLLQKVIKKIVYSERKQLLFWTQSIPHEKWKAKRSNLKYFEVWGYLAKVQVPITKRIEIRLNTVDVKLDLSSLVKGVTNLGKKKRRIYSIKRFRGVVNMKGHILPSNKIL